VKITAGVGFKPEYFEEALSSPADGLWFEVHAENYMVAGGPRLAMLQALRERRPLSLHGVGLSLASPEEPDAEHLGRLRDLILRFEPALVSEHLAWSRLGPISYPDLLPFPRSHAMLAAICRNVQIAQETVGRPISIENPSSYLEIEGHDWSEPDFLGELVRRTGCGLLIDANNIFVSAANLGFDPDDYVQALPEAAVTEYHLAGHSTDPQLGTSLLIDSHDQPITEAVWALYARIVERVGPCPVLIERDGNVPPFGELMKERNRAVLSLLPRRTLHHA